MQADFDGDGALSARPVSAYASARIYRAGTLIITASNDRNARLTAIYYFKINFVAIQKSVDDLSQQRCTGFRF